MYFDDLPQSTLAEDAQVGYGAGVFLTPRTGEIHRDWAEAPTLRTLRSLPVAAPPTIQPVELVISERLRRLDELKDYTDDCSERGAMTERSTEAPESCRSLASMGRTCPSARNYSAESSWATTSTWGNRSAELSVAKTQDFRLASKDRRNERGAMGPSNRIDLSAASLASHQADHASTYQSSSAPTSYRCLPAARGRWATVSDSASGTRMPASQSMASVDWSVLARDLDIPLDFGPSEDILHSYRSMGGSASQASSMARESTEPWDFHSPLHDFSAPRELAGSEDHELRRWAKENVIEGGALPEHRPASSPANNDDSIAQFGAGAVLAGLTLFFAL